MKGFAFPRRFKSEASLLPTLTRNNRELLAFLNTFTVRFQSDASAVVLPGNLSVAGDLSGLNWKAWSPTYTNLTIGNGVVVARYVEMGSTVHVQYELTFGSTTSMGTTPTISTPVTAVAGFTAERAWVGGAVFLDSATNTPSGIVRLNTVNRFETVALDASGTYLADKQLSATIPFTWTTDDMLSFGATFEAA